MKLVIGYDNEDEPSSFDVTVFADDGDSSISTILDAKEVAEDCAQALNTAFAGCTIAPDLLSRAVHFVHGWLVGRGSEISCEVLTYPTYRKRVVNETSRLLH